MRDGVLVPSAYEPIYRTVWQSIAKIMAPQLVGCAACYRVFDSWIVAIVPV
jgi:hypothetical protein